MTTEQITRQDVERVAALARLGLSDEEIGQATEDLASILGHFSQIQDIDTTDVPTYDDASGLNNIATADQARPEELATHEELLDQAPATKDNQIKVTAVFDG